MLIGSFQPNGLGPLQDYWPVFGLNKKLPAHARQIGRYYHGQRQYLAAINRFRNVIENYQTTTHVPEALHRLTEAYLSLGIIDEARKTAAVLGHNFPGSEWYIDSYEIIEGKKGASGYGGQGSLVEKVVSAALLL